MAANTKTNLRNKIIYEVFIRNHSLTGTFKDLQRDLERIKELGVDIIWLMPIYPIGLINRKGTLGCPYSIKDYREINPEYGTLEDFRKLLESIHQKEMQLMIDIVFNHTSHDSWLQQQHPEWFYCRPDGKFGSKVADWDDVSDLDYSRPELWDYQIEILKYWVRQGVDGFRCDVAPLLPIEFWQRARREVQEIKADIIWLAESINPGFIADLRRKHFIAHSDCEMYQAFDITYDYDIYPAFMAYLQGENSLEYYLEMLRLQETTYPDNYVKLRFLENHDHLRARRIFREKEALMLWTAFMYFQKGTVLLYAGQEVLVEKCPSLFEKDLINWDGLTADFSNYLKTLSKIKKDPIFADGHYRIYNPPQSGIIFATYENETKRLLGIFNVEGKNGFLDIDCRDGEYQNIINNETITVKNSKIELTMKPVIFEVAR